MAQQKATWAPAFAVRYDGSTIDEYQASRHGHGYTVRSLDATTGGGRWPARAFEEKFGATRQAAVAKFLAKVRRDVELAQEELDDAQAALARAEALAAEERAAAREEQRH